MWKWERRLTWIHNNEIILTANNDRKVLSDAMFEGPIPVKTMKVLNQLKVEEPVNLIHLGRGKKALRTGVFAQQSVRGYPLEMENIT